MNNQTKLLLLGLSLLMPSLFGQPSNDNCSKPIRIVDIQKYCSNIGEFTNVNATPSGYGPAGCWTSTQGDVWFSFVARASDITVTVIGTNKNNPQNSGGTLKSMQVALYQGSCGGTLSELRCISDVTNIGIVSMSKGGLVIGQTYLLRIDGRNNERGTFKLCINNYFPPATIEQDCNQATVLCSNNPFVNKSFSGYGLIGNEAVASCLGEGGGQGNSEQSSVWYTWIAKTNCKLTFTLTPLNTGDDLDFALYELPSGIHNCNDKKLLRCNASAPPCTNTTGLSLTDTDISENFNCDPGENGFCKYVDVTAGTAYTLIINNFTPSGIGFSIEWGNCDFQGPEPDFQVVPDSGLRCETFFDVQDLSSFLAGKITKYEWNFGVNANPPDANTKGPHQVKYESFGEKYITLTLTTDLGCKISKVKRIVAEPCCEDLPDLEVGIDSIIDLKCFGDNSGRVVFHGIKGSPYTDQLTKLPYYTFSLDGINYDALTSFTNLSAGKYTLYIQDRKGCISSIPFEIKEPEKINVNAGSDQEITLGDPLNLNAEALPTSFYNYDWFASSVSLCTHCQNTSTVPLKDGYYKVIATDPNGCIGEDSIFVRVKKEHKAYFPNVLSANGDNINDFFTIHGNAALESVDKIEIFDRWGGRIFSKEKVQTNEFDRLWDGLDKGVKVNPGVFTYHVRAKFIDGVSEDFSGDITVLR